MTGTRISDLVVPAIWNPYVLEQSTYANKFIASGIAQNVPALEAIKEGGTTVNVPFWVADLSDDMETIVERVPLTPGKLTADNQIGVVIHRGRAWQSGDLAGLASGEDPMQALAAKVAAYLANQEQIDLLACLIGVFGSLADSTGAAFADLTYIPGTLGNITASTIAGMMSKLGDQSEKLSAIAMHSFSYLDLLERKMIDFVKPGDAGAIPASTFTGGSFQNSFASPQDIQIPYFVGKRVIVDDGIAKSGNNYAVYGFTNGAVGTAEQQAMTTETDRDILTGEDAMVVRKHFLHHPLGASWVGPVNPTRAQLATITNWEKVYQTKNIGVVRATVTSNF
jgi:hypothetical protein